MRTVRLSKIVPIGVLLRERRERLGMNANVLGISTGFADGRIAAIEAWTQRHPQRDIPLDSEVQKIAGALGISLRELVSEAIHRGALSVIIGSRGDRTATRRPLLPQVRYLSNAAIDSL